MTDNDPTPRDDAGWAQPDHNQGPSQEPGQYGQARSPWAPEGQSGYYGVGQSPEQIPGKTPGPFPGPQEPGQWQGYGQPESGAVPNQPGQGVYGQGQPGQGQYGQGQFPGGGPSYGYQQHPQPYQQYPQAQQQYVTPAFATPPPVGEPAKKRKGSSKLLIGVAILALVAGGFAGGVGGYFASSAGGGGSESTALGPAPAKEDSPAPKGSIGWVADQVMPSVVQVQVATPRGVASGSGFIITPDGYIMTNNHVVAGAAEGGKIEVALSNGDHAEGKIVGRDPTTDIAVIKIDGYDSLNPAETGRSANLGVGQQVVAIGSPFRLSGTVTSGIVSAMHRPVSAGGGKGGLATVMDAIQTDAAINPGNSGGPLVNMKGQVIGINSAIYSPGGGASGGGTKGNVGIGFAIPIDQARRTAEEIIASGHATQTYIGATVTTAEGGGVRIVEIIPGTPAESSGLKQGDVVTKIEDRDTSTNKALIAAIRTKAPNTTVTLTLKDGNTVDIKLGGKPVDVN